MTGARSLGSRSYCSGIPTVISQRVCSSHRSAATGSRNLGATNLYPRVSLEVRAPRRPVDMAKGSSGAALRRAPPFHNSFGCTAG